MPVTRDLPVDAAPTWTPDGTALIFASDRGGTLNLWRIAIDEQTGAVRGAPEAMTVPIERATRPTLLRDGRRMAYSTFAGAGTVSVVPFHPQRGALAGDEKWLLGGPHLWFGARISPDGRRLLVSRTTTQLDFFLLELRTSSVRRLTNAPGGVRCGEWSPDGSRIVFLSAQRGDRQVRVLHPDTGTVQVVDVPSTGLRRYALPCGRLDLVADSRFSRGRRIPRRSSCVSDRRRRAARSFAFRHIRRARSSRERGRRTGRSSRARPGPGSCSMGSTRSGYETIGDGLRFAAAALMVWLPDDRRLLAQGDRSAIYLIDSATKQHQTVLPAGAHFLRGLSLTTDGRQLFMSKGPEEGDVWVANAPLS